MLTIAIAFGSLALFVAAYHTYGRWIAGRVFRLDADAEVPSKVLRDDVDYAPTHRSVVFGHHFTSIAGTGPIVGPAIAVFWGWLPALLWVVLGAIFVGAVHDLGALVISLRNRGQTIGEVAGRVISPRARLLFLLVLFFALTVVIAIFGLVIATIFNMYPQSVLSVLVAMPIAMAVGWLVYKRGVGLLWPSLISLGLLYVAVWLGVYGLGNGGWEITMPEAEQLGASSPTVLWTIVLLIYCFIASVLPVWLLLQPRDYINSHQLLVALALLIGGLLVAGLTGNADLMASTEPISSELPSDAPPLMPFLFIIIACGACSGFHCLVGSGTTSKQISCETDAQFVGYGSMLLEGMLAVLVILACCSGLGMGVAPAGGGDPLTGRAAWESKYRSEDTVTTTAEGAVVAQGAWSKFKLPQMVGAFVEGGANFISTLRIPRELCVAIVAVLVACFAATTLDTSTRLQRYVIQELGNSLHIPPLTDKYVATTVAVVAGGAVAMIPGPKGPGTGGLLLWPLFGATNQLLAGLALMVLVFFLLRRNLPVWFAALPMLLMLVVPGWGMLYNILFQWNDEPMLFAFGAVILALQLWMIIEAVLMWPRVRGVLEEPLPPLPARASSAG